MRFAPQYARCQSSLLPSHHCSITSLGGFAGSRYTYANKVPPAKLLVLHAAVRVLPIPVRATAAQPEIELTPSLKLTVPVGFVPVTVAVKVTLAPSVAGLAEVVSVVVVGAPPPLLFPA